MEVICCEYKFLLNKAQTCNKMNKNKYKFREI